MAKPCVTCDDDNVSKTIAAKCCIAFNRSFCKRSEHSIACSRWSDSRAQKKNSRFPGVQLNSLPTYRRARLSECLEQAKHSNIKWRMQQHMESVMLVTHKRLAILFFLTSLLFTKYLQFSQFFFLPLGVLALLVVSFIHSFVFREQCWEK